MTWYVPVVGSGKILRFRDSGWTERRGDDLSKLKVTTYCRSAKNCNCQRNHFVDWRHLGFLQRGSEAKISDISERFLDITITGHLLLLMLSPEDLRELNIKERAGDGVDYENSGFIFNLTVWCLTFGVCGDVRWWERNRRCAKALCEAKHADLRANTSAASHS